jgi:hypothetical protein
MAFFGLTQLGPQSSLASGRLSLDEFNVSIFTLSEFAAAWDAEAAGSASLPVGAVAAVLARVFRGPAPPREAARVAEALAARSSDASAATSAAAASSASVSVSFGSAAAASGGAGSAAAAVSRAAFLDVIDALQRAPPTADTHLHAHYTSFDALRAHKLLERRPLAGPAELDIEPRTASGAIGFEAHKARPHVIHCALHTSAGAARARAYYRGASACFCDAHAQFRKLTLSALPPSRSTPADVTMSDITKFKSELIKAGVDYA